MLVFLLAAIAGPWTFDLLYVPVKYECTPPTIRLEGDFCGVKLSGLWVISFVIPAFFQMIVLLVRGQAALRDIRGEFLVSVLLSLLALPFISTILLIMHEGRNRLWLHMAALSIGLAVSLWFGLFKLTAQSWHLWGVWSFSAVLAGMLVLEALTLTLSRKETVDG